VYLVRKLLFGPLYKPWKVDEGGVRNGRGDQGTERKPALTLLCPQQIPDDLTWN
jgi:hypothetical protein